MRCLLPPVAVPLCGTPFQAVLKPQIIARACHQILATRYSPPFVVSFTLLVCLEEDLSFGMFLARVK